MVKGYESTRTSQLSGDLLVKSLDRPVTLGDWGLFSLPEEKPNTEGLNRVTKHHRLVVIIISVPDRALEEDKDWRSWVDNDARLAAATVVERRTGVSKYDVDLWSTDLVYMTKKRFYPDNWTYLTYHVRVTWEE